MIARIGIECLTLVDFDTVELRNLDRPMIATQSDLGMLKVAVAEARARMAATASHIRIKTSAIRCDEQEALLKLLDFDVIFSCVDRPWPRRVLNQLSYAALIPIIIAGILVSKRDDHFIGADWHVQTIGPERRCMQCWNAFDPTDATLDFAGLLDDPDGSSLLS